MRKLVENMTIPELRKEHDRIMDEIHNGNQGQKIRDRLSDVQKTLSNKGYIMKRIWVKDKE